MEDDQSLNTASPYPTPRPRRFIYRSADPEPQASHPARRKTDTPRAFQGIPGQTCPNLSIVKMRVYLKLN